MLAGHEERIAVGLAIPDRESPQRLAASAGRSGRSCGLTRRWRGRKGEVGDCVPHARVARSRNCRSNTATARGHATHIWSGTGLPTAVSKIHDCVWPMDLQDHLQPGVDSGYFGAKFRPEIRPK
jgi:hypothetical protein